MNTEPVELAYLAAPVRPVGVETVDWNLDRAEDYLGRVCRANPHVAIVAPWIHWLRLGVDNDADPASRAQGLARSIAAARPCTQIILCGPRISGGMFLELEAVCDGNRLGGGPGAVIHRFTDTRASFVLPRRWRCMPVGVTAADLLYPSWLSSAALGASPLGASVAFAEILGAFHRERATT